MDHFLDNEPYSDYNNNALPHNPQDPLQPPSYMMHNLEDHSPSDTMNPHAHHHNCHPHQHQHAHHAHAHPHSHAAAAAAAAAHHHQQQQQQQQSQQQHAFAAQSHWADQPSQVANIHQQQQHFRQQHRQNSNPPDQPATTASTMPGAFFAHAHPSDPQARSQFLDYQPSVSDISSRPTSSDENWQYAVHMPPPAQAFAQESHQAQYAPYVPNNQSQAAAMFAEFTAATAAAAGPSTMAPSAANMALVPGNRNSFGATSNSSVESYGPLQNFQHEMTNNLAAYVQQQQQQQQHQMASGPFGNAGTFGSVSPQDTTIETLSASSPSDAGWQIVDLSHMSGRPSNEPLFDVYPAMTAADSLQAVSAGASIANPGLTLHIRTGSNESSQQPEPDSSSSNASFASFDHVDAFAMDTSSPEATYDYPRTVSKGGRATHAASSPTDSAGSTSPKSPASAGSFNARKRKTLELAPAPGSKGVAKKGTLSQRKDAGGIEKKVGRRKGPLRPEQRKQAGEIRKLRACLRCRFLKKTCDTGDPCSGCQPSHARLWQVPCTRIDIRDLHYFVKAFREVDFNRHVKPGTSALNIVNYGDRETPMYITHGFGFVLPIQAREIVVRDPEAFKADWVETLHEKPVEFEVETMALTVSTNGLTHEMALQYLDKHITSGWDHFVDKQFQGTLFWTEMLKTVHKFWLKTKQPILKAALEMVLAYNLTQHICWAEGFNDDSTLGKVVDPESCYRGKTAAPIFINFHVKSVFAKIWRDAQRTVLEKLSELWSAFYTGEKAKNWPVILMAASMLLIMWEEMEFDANYRMEDQEAIRKFRHELGTTPVGVIVGLFSAMCQKYPQFAEWDSEKHGHVVNNDTTVCSMLEEVRGHIHQYNTYLEERPNAKFDRDDFDSLCNKYLSRLILRKTPA